jgi:hypothetical protein
MRLMAAVAVVVQLVPGCWSLSGPEESGLTLWLDSAPHSVEAEHGLRHEFRGTLGIRLNATIRDVPGPDAVLRRAMALEISSEQGNGSVAIDAETWEPFAFVDRHDIVRWESNPLRYHDMIPFVLIRLVGVKLYPNVDQETTLLGIPVTVVMREGGWFDVYPFGRGNEAVVYRMRVTGNHAIPTEIRGGLAIGPDVVTWRKMDEDSAQPSGDEANPSADAFRPVPWVRLEHYDGLPPQGAPASMPFTLDAAIQQARADRPEVRDFFAAPGPHVLVEGDYRHARLAGAALDGPVQHAWTLLLASPSSRLRFQVTHIEVAAGVGHGQTEVLEQEANAEFEASEYTPRDIVVLEDAFRVCQTMYPEEIHLRYRDSGHFWSVAFGNQTYPMEDLYYSCGPDGLADFSLQLDGGSGRFLALPIKAAKILAGQAP